MLFPGPADINIIAKSIVDQTTAAELFNSEIVKKAIAEGKDPLAVMLGQRGGLKGGRAGTDELTKKRRKEITHKAAQTGWSKKS